MSALASSHAYLAAFAFMIAVSSQASADPPAAKQAARFSVTITGGGHRSNSEGIDGKSKADATEVILIPGLASSGKVWDATVKQLSAKHRVHVIQIAGFGGAPAELNGDVAAGELLAALVVDLGNYAATLKSPSIIGHSLGGLIALQIAATKPELPARVLVVDSLPFYPLVFNPAATVELMKPQAIALRDQMMVQTDADRAAATRVLVQRMSKSSAGQAAIAEWSLASDRQVVARAVYECMLADVRPSLAHIKTKITVVYAWDAAMGVPSSTLDALYTSAYASLPKATLHRIDGGFHFIMLDQQKAFAREVDEFLK